MSFTLDIEPGGRDHMLPSMPSLTRPTITASPTVSPKGRGPGGHAPFPPLLSTVPKNHAVSCQQGQTALA